MTKEYTPQEIRDAILKFLQFQDEQNIIHTRHDLLETALLPIDSGKLYRELRYLRDHSYITSKGTIEQPLFFTSISAKGRDYVEGVVSSPTVQTIVNNFTNVSNSNISINSQKIQQIIRDNNVSEEVTAKLEELIEAVKSKNKSKILSLLGFIADKSVDVLTSILVSGII